MKRLVISALIPFLLLACSEKKAPPQPVAAIEEEEVTDCSKFFVSGTPPVLTNPKLQAKTQPICFSGFAVLHSGVTRTPLYAAEYMTKAKLTRARQVAREDSFHSEKIIPVGERAELSDYTNSGYDRGHLAPAADMPSIRAQSESFSLANMTPQNPNNNRGIWSDIESATRGLVTKRGEIYIVSGPMFLGNKVQRMNGRVLVPTHYYKAIYDPKRQEAGAYVVENKENAVPKVISITELTKMSGVQVFPKLTATVQNTAMSLPIPNSGNP